MANIHTPTSPLARCAACHVQRQFHFKSDVPHSADRDHEFVAETAEDFEPGELNPKQLVAEIFAQPNTARAVACRVELRAQTEGWADVSWDDLQEAGE